MDKEGRLVYSETLLAASIPHRPVCRPLGLCESWPVKELRYKKKFTITKDPTVLDLLLVIAPCS